MQYGVERILTKVPLEVQSLRRSVHHEGIAENEGREGREEVWQDGDASSQLRA